MPILTIDYLKQHNLIVQECISGSRAYGLHTATSDTDIKGVFVLPKHLFYAREYTPQVSDATNDTVYYELGRYIELLSVNNPNIMELLNTPSDKVLYQHPLMQQITSKLFLSQLCKQTFGNFAVSQIKKATGLNKKMMTPMDKEHKSVLDFCYIACEQGSVAVTKWLNDKGWDAKNCGLVKLNNMRDVYGVYHNPCLDFNGMVSAKTVGQVTLSSIPKGEPQQAIMYVNSQGFSAYCKDYKSYWQWVAERNEARYQTNHLHGKGYDTKNMMHVMRLLDMAIEIAEQGQVNVQRANRDFLLRIKQGNFEYDELLAMADDKQQRLAEAFTHCDLPLAPIQADIHALHVSLREQFYQLAEFE